MDGKRALAVIGEHRTDQVVVTTMSTAREWPQLSSREDLDIPLIGCMGKASSMGLGVAIGAPERQVLVLDGEGSLLMNLGSLVTIGSQAPKNLVHFVFDNAAYDTSGGQPTPGARAVDFAGMAINAGYKSAFRFRDANEFREKLPRILSQEGPILVQLQVEKGWADATMPKRTTRQAMGEVAAAIGRRS